jgi:hypothetical protein
MLQQWADWKVIAEFHSAAKTIQITFFEGAPPTDILSGILTDF